VAEHWNEARGDRLMPAWKDIRPAAIAAQLGSVWAYSYDWSTSTFTGRLSGARIAQIFGRELKGLPMAEVYPSAEYPVLFERQQKVVLGPCLALSHGTVFRHLDRLGTGERIILPLRDSGDRADGIFGATEYTVLQGSAAEASIVGDSWKWFPLR
jgi:hypothetical protein